MSGGDALHSPKPLRRSSRRSPPEAAATPPTPTRPTRRGLGSGPSTPGRRGRSRSRTRRSPSTAAAAQRSPAASSSGSPQTPRTAFEAIQVGASEEKDGRRVGGRMLGVLLLLVAVAAVIASGVLLSAGARRAVSEPEPVVVEPAVAAPSAPLFVVGDARKKAVAVEPEEKTPDPVAEQEPADLPALEAAPAVAVEEKGGQEDQPAAVTAPEQPPPLRRRNASIPDTAAVPTQQQHLDAVKEAFTQRKAKQQSTPHPFFGAAVDKAGRAEASAATAAAAAAREDHTASAASTSTTPVPVAADERAAGPSFDAKAAKMKDAAATKSRRKPKQQQKAATTTIATGTGQDRTAPPRPRTVLRVGEALLAGGKMGNRCFDFGPSGFCSPSTYLALDGSGRLELREGWETTSGGKGTGKEGKEPPLPGRRKWQARRRVRWGKLLQKGLGRLNGQEEEAGGSYRLRLSEHGMLELLGPDGEWAWRSGVEGGRNTTYEAFVSDEGKLVIFRGPQVHWRSA